MRLLGLVATALLVASATPAIARIGVDGPNGFRLNLNVNAEPGGQHLRSMVAGEEGRLHRVLFDDSQRRYFAYDLVMVASGPEGLRVAVEPLRLSAAELAGPPLVDPSWTAVPLLKPRAAQDVRAGDRWEVELLQNPATGQRFVDVVRFSRPGAK